MKKALPDTAVLRLSRAGRLRVISKPPGFPELSKVKLERMRRSIAESRDPTRYVIAVRFAERATFYYRAEDAGFGSHIRMATLFKQEKVAEAVRSAIYGRKLRDKLKVVRVKKTKTGVRVVSRAELPNS